jgi:(1->4)-alpha-D-glucan 1-alpha-D-glucosylmutase
VRQAKGDLFANGGYEGLDVRGERAENVVAFARTAGEDGVIVAVPRLVAGLDAQPGWGDTVIPVPASGQGRRWRNALTGAVVEATEGESGVVLPLARVLSEEFPFALLVREG